MSYFSFFSEVGGIDLSERGNDTQLANQSATWWFSFRTFVVVCDRPVHVKRDERNRLHCEDGPAIVWPDGFGVWSIHGVRVKRDVIEGTLTVAMIEAESNAEVRRIMVDRFGRARYLLESGAENINSDVDKAGKPRTLYRKKRPGDDDLVMVAVVNSTPEPDGTFKNYFLQVPPTMKTAAEAVAWTAYETEATYQPGVGS